MIKEIRYKNFKSLRDATLPLGRFTLIVGANGTGKTTALRALEIIDNLTAENFPTLLTNGLHMEKENIQIEIFWEDFSYRRTIGFTEPTMNHLFDNRQNNLGGSPGKFTRSLSTTYLHESEGDAIESFKMFSFDSIKIAEPTVLKSKIDLKSDGSNLAGVLWQIQSAEPELFESFNAELNRWFPEFDRAVFEIPETADGKVSFLLRTKFGRNKIKAEDLSDGTRLALAYLTIAYLPNPPKIVAFEEPEKGIHPRLLENMQEAMYRLAYPENYDVNVNRDPVQVIATTHSPYLLDLYKDFPEEVVIASKDKKGAHFERLIDKPHYEEILQDAPLGEIWYSGVLGGVPANL